MGDALFILALAIGAFLLLYLEDILKDYFKNKAEIAEDKRKEAEAVRKTAEANLKAAEAELEIERLKRQPDPTQDRHRW